MRRKIFFGLLFLFFGLSAAGHYMHWNMTLQFVISCIAVIFVAGFLGQATENVAHYAGERVGGLLNATFGNAAELIIAIFLVKEGLFDMVKASITGSIIGNMLLVLGLSLFMGGLKFKTQKYNASLASHSATLMLLSIIALFVPAMFEHGLDRKHNEMFSMVVAGFLIVAYLLWLFFSMVTHKKELSDVTGIVHTAEHDEPIWSKRKSIIYLIIATIMVALVSEWLVHALHDFSEKFGLSELFVGAFLIAIIGNAAEHSAAIMLAMKNKIGAAVEIAIGSSLQIALFVAPVLVFVSFFLPGPTMDLVFSTYELVAIGVAVFITKSISRDGQTNWYEGFLLLTVYAILGVAFYLV